MLIRVASLFMLSCFRLSSAEIDPLDYAVDADWSKMLIEAKKVDDESIGPFDTGEFSRMDHTPFEAFIRVEPDLYFTDSTTCNHTLACDPHGPRPCCSPFGWCGNDNEFCTCVETVSDKGEELGACKDYRDVPKRTVKKKGYESYYKSGENPLPIMVFWKFPVLVMVWSFSFEPVPGQMASAPLRYEVVGSRDAHCEDSSRETEWFQLFEGKYNASDPDFYGEELTVKTDSSCVGIEINNTKSGEAALKNINVVYINYTGEGGSEQFASNGSEKVATNGSEKAGSEEAANLGHRLIVMKKEKKDSGGSSCGGLCIGMIFLGIFLVAAITLTVVYFVCCREDDSMNYNRGADSIYSNGEDIDSSSNACLYKQLYISTTSSSEDDEDNRQEANITNVIRDSKDEKLIPKSVKNAMDHLQERVDLESLESFQIMPFQIQRQDL